jgi:phenylalanyl-tRNA synthetase beta subunit
LIEFPHFKLKQNLTKQLFDIEKIIYDADSSITKIYETSSFADPSFGENKISHTLAIEFEDANNELTRDKIEAIRSIIIQKLRGDFNATIRGDI